MRRFCSYLFARPVLRDVTRGLAKRLASSYSATRHSHRHRCIALLIATTSLAVAEAATPTDTFLENVSDETADCPFSVDTRPHPHAIALQFLNGRVHKWEVHRLASGKACLVLLRPEMRILSAVEADSLLKASARWVAPQQPAHISSHTALNIDPDAAPPPPVSSNTAQSSVSTNMQDTKIFGQESRQPVINCCEPDGFPYAVVGQVQTSNTQPYTRATAFLITPYLALTNAHVVEEGGQLLYAPDVKFAAAQYKDASKGPDTVKPFGYQLGCALGIDGEYYTARNEDEKTEHDLGAIFFKTPWSAMKNGDRLLRGYPRLTVELEDPPTQIKTAGYPLSVDGVADAVAEGQMWYEIATADLSFEEGVIKSRLDSSKGQSGSPYWSHPDYPWVVGMHRGVQTGRRNPKSLGLRFNENNLDYVEAWMDEAETRCDPTLLYSDVRWDINNIAGVPHYFKLEVGGSESLLRVDTRPVNSPRYYKVGPSIAITHGRQEFSWDAVRCETKGFVLGGGACVVLSPQPGDYYLKLEGDYEDIRLQSSHDANPDWLNYSLTQGDSDCIPLYGSSQVVGLSGAANSERCFYYDFIDVPHPNRTEVLNFTLSGANGFGNADLYVKRGKRPITWQPNDCVSTLPEHYDGCDLYEPERGGYYIVVKGSSDYENWSLSTKYGWIFEIRPSYSLEVKSTGIADVSIQAEPAEWSGVTNYIHHGLAQGLAVRLTAPATHEGFGFVRWEGCDAADDRACDVTLSSDVTVIAVYAPSSQSLCTTCLPSRGGWRATLKP